MTLLEKIKANACKHRTRIVLPEACDERTLRAADIIIAEGIADIILIGKPDGEKIRAPSYSKSLRHRSGKPSEKTSLCRTFAGIAEIQGYDQRKGG